MRILWPSILLFSTLGSIVTSAQSARPETAIAESIPVKLVNRGLLPTHLVIDGNPVRVGSFSHAYVGFPAGTEIRTRANKGRGRLVHVITAANRNKEIRVR
jgi:hypothetical protein